MDAWMGNLDISHYHMPQDMCIRLGVSLLQDVRFDWLDVTIVDQLARAKREAERQTERLTCFLVCLLACLLACLIACLLAGSSASFPLPLNPHGVRALRRARLRWRLHWAG